MIKTQSYSVNNNLLTNQILGIYINNFWSDVFTPLISSGDKHLLLMCKVEFNDTSVGYRTLGDLRRVNFNDRDLFIEYLSARLGLLNDSYFTNPICKITFTYIIKQGLSTDERRLLQDLTPRSNTTHRFNNLNLPMSMNPSDFGNIILSNHIQINGESVHRIIVDSGTKTFQFDIYNNGTVNKVTILGSINLTWTDTQISDNTFKREIGKSTIYFMDGERILTQKQLNAKPIKNLSVDNELDNNFITMDMETKNDLGKLIPYLICGYNGKDYITSYANENLDQKVLFTSFIKQLVTFFIKGNNTITVYAHNLSGFDGIFLMKNILELGKVTPLLNNGKIITITLKLNIPGNKNKTIVFRDSLLLLPHSLRILCKAFKIDVPKGHFPFLLNDIFYKGVLPKFELWTGLELSEFTKLLNKYANIEWNFKEEAIKYCKLDCATLHQILVQFNLLIFTHFKVNIINSLTLPALAMRIYKIHFMPKDTIYQLLGKPEQDIRESYTGGAVDVYKPHNMVSSFFSKIKATFNKLFCYDVNSLYPFIMAKTMMPVGRPIAFEGDIRNIKPQAFGFFYCKITSPEYLEHPILQRRIETSDGTRTIAGLGTWEGWVYSPEMDNAINYGYTFEILKGYLFDKGGNVFESYITKMYDLRLQYPKGNAMNLIAKLLMNSLYGKFGMKLNSTSIEMFNTSIDTELQSFKNLLDTQPELFQDFVQIGNHFLTIRKNLIDVKYIEAEEVYHGIDINVAIASAITAGGRIYMSFFKNNPLFNLYYSDTDSFVIDAKLPNDASNDLVGSGLGKLKLEYVINRAVFLAPKVYGLILDDGTEIIIVVLLYSFILNFNFNF